MFITKEEIAERLAFRHCFVCNSVELVGDVGTFGEIVFNNSFEMRIFISDENKIMDLLEDFMLNQDELFKFKDPKYPFSHDSDYPLLDIKFPPNPNLFNEADFEEFDLYWIFHPCKKLSREVRKELKALGYMCQRHSQTNEEMWVFDKVDWKKVDEMKERMSLPKNPPTYGH